MRSDSGLRVHFLDCHKNQSRTGQVRYPTVSGLVWLLKSTIKQHDNQEGAPSAMLQGKTSSGRARAADEDAHMYVYISN